MKLIKYPHPILRRTAKRVAIFDDALRQIARGMIKVMLESNGIGLAAVQVGICKRLIVVSDGVLAPQVLCNPVLVSQEGEQVGAEGCLSFPNVWKEVKRFDSVTVKFQDLSGAFKQLKTSGLLSRCCQHEIDHLDGLLFIDYEPAEAAAELF